MIERFYFNKLDENHKDERIEWCANNLCALYRSHPLEYSIVDNKLIIYGDVVIPDEYEELPIKIDEVYGDIIMSNTINRLNGKLASFKNFPDIVHGSIKASFNKKLVSLKHCPKQIDGTLWLSCCSIKDFTDFDSSIGGCLVLNANDIINIDGIDQQKIYGEIILTGNPITKEFAGSKYKNLLESRKFKF